MGSERKVVLVTRRTRLEDLLARYHTLSQARFYIEHLGADFSDYVSENAAYAQGLRVTVQALQAWGRYQVVDRSFLANFVFSADDIVVALGQDGLVANTMKYLDGQPLIGLNPEPARWDGLLLPFKPDELAAVLPDVASDKRPTRRVTMAQVTLSDGQRMRAVNDLFIGPRTHASALYELEIDGRKEAQSSSGVIVSTGLGSTAWMKSVLTGAASLARRLQPGPAVAHEPQAWDAQQLTFAVREPFPSRSSQAELVYGHVTPSCPLKLRSRMPENGVIFSDGIESDFLRFNAGVQATVTLARETGCLAV
jgi:NAD kinase